MVGEILVSRCALSEADLLAAATRPEKDRERASERARRDGDNGIQPRGEDSEARGRK